MDPEVLAVFKQKILQLKTTKGIVMATHIMHEAQELADWVAVMHQGQIISSEAYDNSIPFHQLYQQAIDEHHARQG
jgi:ABC-type multidrug transport system ATPase subunit